VEGFGHLAGHGQTVGRNADGPGFEVARHGQRRAGGKARDGSLLPMRAVGKRAGDVQLGLGPIDAGQAGCLGQGVFVSLVSQREVDVAADDRPELEVDQVGQRRHHHEG